VVVQSHVTAIGVELVAVHVRSAIAGRNFGDKGAHPRLRADAARADAGQGDDAPARAFRKDEGRDASIPILVPEKELAAEGMKVLRQRNPYPWGRAGCATGNSARLRKLRNGVVVLAESGGFGGHKNGEREQRLTDHAIPPI
jgi:hypothetical protein